MASWHSNVSGEMTQFQNEAVRTQPPAIQMRAGANHLGMWSLPAQTFQVVIGKYVMHFRYYFTTRGWIVRTIAKFHFNLVLPMYHRLRNREAKLVRTVFKGRTERLWFKAKESILQIQINGSALLLYRFGVLASKWRSERKQNAMNFPCNLSHFIRWSFLPRCRVFLWERK